MQITERIERQSLTGRRQNRIYIHTYIRFDLNCVRQEENRIYACAKNPIRSQSETQIEHSKRSKDKSQSDGEKVYEQTCPLEFSIAIHCLSTLILTVFDKLNRIHVCAKIPIQLE